MKSRVIVENPLPPPEGGQVAFNAPIAEPCTGSRLPLEFVAWQQLRGQLGLTPELVATLVFAEERKALGRE